MVRYLQTMRRLVLLLATRERKAARLIRERWLTKAILERNSNRLRPLLEALLGSVCIDKPDRLLDYATEWVRTNFPAEAEEAASSDCRCMWSPRDDIEPTQEALMDYLEETNATSILEGIIERAIAAQPSNVHAYVLDELVAQNPDILLETDEETSDEEGDDTFFGELAGTLAAEEVPSPELRAPPPHRRPASPSPILSHPLPSSPILSHPLPSSPTLSSPSPILSLSHPLPRSHSESRSRHNILGRTGRSRAGGARGGGGGPARGGDGAARDGGARRGGGGARAR